MQAQVKELTQLMEFPEGGILSRILVKTQSADYTLFCLAQGTEISEHTATRDAAVVVLKGRGRFTVAGEEIPVQAGTFLFMPAHAPHALRAEEDLAFLLILSGA
ncbi:MAG: cupin domain-containing protein [Nitrospinota bacterium]|nr:MAG: cupin domain-containing protein [Nitrospinota bacterium]